MELIPNHIASLLNERDLARLTGLSVASVRRWRLLGQGPKFLKLGASPKAAVRYQKEDISAWLASRPSGGGYPAEVPQLKQRRTAPPINGGVRHDR